MLRSAPRSRKSILRHWGHRAVRFLRATAMLEDTPRRIALGSGIGLFFAAQPFVGSQMIAAALTARLTRASVLASLPWTWLTNPITVTPIYYGAYCLGCVVWPDEKQVDYERISAMAMRVEEIGIIRFFEGGWREVLRLLADIAIPLQIGSLIVGTIAGLLGYVILHRLVVAVQARRLAKRRRWLASITVLTVEPEPMPPAPSTAVFSNPAPAAHPPIGPSSTESSP